MEKISSNVLQMKFMQKTRRKLEEAKAKAEEGSTADAFLSSPLTGSLTATARALTNTTGRVYSVPSLERAPASCQPSGSTKSSVVKEPEFLYERSYEILEKLKFGRFSFQGFNPEVEKLMTYYDLLASGKKPDDDADDQLDKDISDEAMTTTLGRKFVNKRDRAFLDERADRLRDDEGGDYSSHSSSKRARRH